MNNEIWPKNGAFAAKRLSGTRVITCRSSELMHQFAAAQSWENEGR